MTRLAGILIGAACGAAVATPCDYSDAHNRVRAMLAGHPELDGASILIGDAEGTLHEAYFGAYGPETVVPVASASKWLSGTAIMTLIDSGAMDPDAPVRTVLPEFSLAATGLKATMTPRQMYAHISGLPGEESEADVFDPTITMAEAVAQIACCIPLDDQPGESFAYGGLSMHVTGRMAELISGKDFETFFADALAGPLGMTTVDFQGLGPTTNPRVSGGARSSLVDYARMLRMIVRGGELDGVRVLSPGSVTAMLDDQTEGLPRREPTPPGGEEFGYGFGGWVSRKDEAGRTTEFQSPGAFGFTPWVDTERGIYGIIMVEGTRRLILEDLDAIKAAMIAGYDACGPVCAADLAPVNANDGRVNFFDVSVFLQAFAGGLPLADFHPAGGNGTLNFFDVSGFLDAYAAGCP